jgi:hypothetical protein
MAITTSSSIKVNPREGGFVPRTLECHPDTVMTVTLSPPRRKVNAAAHLVISPFLLRGQNGAKGLTGAGAGG